MLRLRVPASGAGKQDTHISFSDYRFLVNIFPASEYGQPAPRQKLERSPNGKLVLPALVRERVLCDEFLRSEIEAATSEATLTPFCATQKKFSRAERITIHETYAAAQRTAAGKYDGSIIQANDDKAPLAPTGAGRYFTTIKRLRELLPHDHVVRIGQVGLGLDQYGLMRMSNPRLYPTTRRLQSTGAVVEPFELATLGLVTAMDWDQRIIEALKQNKQEGFVIDDTRALNWASPRFDLSKVASDPAIFAAAQALLDSWRDYVYSDLSPRIMRSKDRIVEQQGRSPIGSLVRVKDEIARAISAQCVDAVVESLLPKHMPKGATQKQVKSGIVKPKPVDPYDVIWGTSFLGYHPLPLQLTTLFKMVDALTMGGLLVVDHSMFRPPIYPSEYSFTAATEKLFDLMGVDIVDVLERPLETMSDVIIGRRARPSPWLDGRMGVINRVGMNE